jgi:hypothetical protein
MGFIIAGKSEELPGIVCESWLQNRALRLTPEDRRVRRVPWLHSIGLHTTKGLPAKHGDPLQKILPGRGPNTNAGVRLADMWEGDSRHAGAHLVVDFDGRVSQCADLVTEAAYHAGQMNEWSIGIEIAQRGDGALFAGQLEQVVLLVDVLTLRFGIQRQYVRRRYLNSASRRLLKDPGGWVGVFGHRDVSNNRGAGDPGDAIYGLLGAADYEGYDPDMGKGQDVEVWEGRQRQLGLHPDGLPGPQTRQAIRMAGMGRGHGLWVVRPVDSLASSPDLLG